MGHHEHNLAIFRGKLKFKSNEQKIWGVFIFLSIITIIEVALGIVKPEALMTPYISAFDGGFMATMANIVLAALIYMKPLNLIFIVLTIVKAYYITWDFMHMRDETSILRRVVVWTAVFLILYLTFILIQEGGYIFDVYDDTSNYIKTDF